MTGHFSSLVFIWLPLMLRIAVTSGQNNGSTFATTVDATEWTGHQVTTPEASSPYSLSNTSGHPPTTAGLTLTEETTPAEVFSVNPRTVNSLTNDTSSSVNTSVAATTGETPIAVTGTAQTGNSTNSTTATQMPGNSTQSQDTGQTSPSNASMPPTPSTEMRSSAAASTEAGDVPSASTTQTPGGGISVAQSTTSHQTPAATKPTRTTKATKRPGRPGDKTKPSTGTNYGRVVAGVIGGALVFMALGFLFIYFKKRKLDKQKVTITDWAGPSPFLDGGSNGEVSRRSSNRISLSSFLPSRMSKRLSLLPETEEELQDMTPATFGSKHLESSSSQKVNGNGVQESNGSAALDPKPTPTPDSTETRENATPPSQMENSLSTNNNSDESDLKKNSSDSPPDASAAVEKAPEQTVVDLGET